MRRVGVSVLVPVYNAEKYLSACLESLLSSTLKNFEIICINDGSTDSSLKILKTYAARDSKIRIIDKKNSGYGDSMNKGLKKAAGEYIAILEPDDYIEPEGLEVLYLLATSARADVARANYYHVEKGKSRKQNIVSIEEVGFPVNPRVTKHIFRQPPAIWSALYRRAFLEKNQINFLPTPGASYQDTSFNFKVWSLAKTAVFTEHAYVHYRLDNSSSSVNDSGKVYCVCEEYAEIEKFLQEKNLYEELGPTFEACKFASYLWNIDRLSPKLAKEFVAKIKPEFSEKTLNLAAFTPSHRPKVKRLVKYPPAVFCTRYFLRRVLIKIKNFVSRANKALRPAYRRQIKIMDEADLLANQNELLLDDLMLLKQELERAKV